MQSFLETIEGWPLNADGDPDHEGVILFCMQQIQWSVNTEQKVPQFMECLPYFEERLAELGAQHAERTKEGALQMVSLTLAISVLLRHAALAVQSRELDALRISLQNNVDTNGQPEEN